MQPAKENSKDKTYEVRSDPGGSPEIDALRWRLAARMAFRLVFAYEILYNFPFPLNMVPALHEAFHWHAKSLELSNRPGRPYWVNKQMT